MTNGNLESLKSVYLRHGVRDNSYLENCYNRFVTTKAVALRGVSGKITVLDIGAHWLSASLLYAIDGHKVIGADLFLNPEENVFIGKIAEEFGIDLITYRDLSRPREFAGVPEGSVDLVLFTEILEHITFNPVEFWKEVYRMLKPNGRIIVTTPNYFHLPNLVKEFLQVIRGYGSGASVDHILETNTFGHHWRLYSARDIRRYFPILSRDFRVTRIRYANPILPKHPLKAFLFKIIGLAPCFREYLYCEITLGPKQTGLTLRPHW